MNELIEIYIDTLAQANHDLVVAKSKIVGLNNKVKELEKEIEGLKEIDEKIDNKDKRENI